MIKSHCFGIIPLTFRENYWEVFLIQHLNGGHWGFPKGHSEKGESPKETAARELLEETGMQIVRYLPYPYLVEKYQYMWEGHLVDKTVRFYPAEVTPQYTLQSEEIVQGKWMPLKDLLSHATFEEEKNLYLALIKMLSE
ncbi:MAG: bis(5'-nucleosyl)-tetraphosphatase [Simkaniaceae bacterium]|jgi:bis(5'-nucleosidyl)-tetraphosphatase